MSQSLAANGDVVITLGNAGRADTHRAGGIVAVDDGIIAWLARRERRRPINADLVAEQQFARAGADSGERRFQL
jgi:hypothetical protein